jgi:probable HAF family extracellular repeat protein
MNDMGQIVGASQTSNGNTQAFLWQGGAMTDIGTLGGYENSRARDINNLGQVVGYEIVDEFDGNFIPGDSFLWSNNTITTLYSRGFWANSINDTEQIAAFCTSILIPENLYNLACLGQDGQLTTLHPDGISSAAYDINNLGQVVGGVGLGTSNNQGFLWQDSTAIELGTLGGSNSDAYAINDVGQVVGKSQTTTGDFHAFFWDGAMQDLGTLDGYTTSIAYGINNKGRVVGTATTSSGSSHAFVRLNNGIRDLNNLIRANSGWELIEARDINNNGRIVGYGTVNGENHAFVLTPTWVTQ